MFSIFQAVFDYPGDESIRFVDGFKTEAAIVQEKRDIAMKKMKEIKRTSLLNGGHFSLKNTVLMGAQR